MYRTLGAADNSSIRIQSGHRCEREEQEREEEESTSEIWCLTVVKGGQVTLGVKQILKSSRPLVILEGSLPTTSCGYGLL